MTVPQHRSLVALLSLADGRFPSGSHAHSGGVEAAVADGRVRDEATLEAYVRGRLATTGLVDAAIAAATTERIRRCRSADDVCRQLRMLDGEADARILVEALRRSSRRLGRQLVRAASRCWPSAELALVVDEFPDGAHQSVVLGVVGLAVAADPAEVASLAVHQAVMTPVQAGLRLLGLDPFGVAALVARLAADIDAVVGDAVAASVSPPAELPALAAPATDIAATDHAAWPVRLFAT